MSHGVMGWDDLVQCETHHWWMCRPVHGENAVLGAGVLSLHALRSPSHFCSWTVLPWSTGSSGHAKNWSAGWMWRRKRGRTRNTSSRPFVKTAMKNKDTKLLESIQRRAMNEVKGSGGEAVWRNSWGTWSVHLKDTEGHLAAVYGTKPARDQEAFGQHSEGVIPGGGPVLGWELDSILVGALQPRAFCDCVILLPWWDPYRPSWSIAGSLAVPFWPRTWIFHTLPGCHSSSEATSVYLYLCEVWSGASSHFYCQLYFWVIWGWKQIYWVW